RPVADGPHVPRRPRLPRDLAMSASATDDRSALVVIGGISLAIVLVVGYLLLGHTPQPEAGALAATLPLLNACLNATSAALLSAGGVFIGRTRVTAHKTCMVWALVGSPCLWGSYATHHPIAGA